MEGTAFVSLCEQGSAGFVADEGLFNEATVIYGTNDLTITTNACGNIPPVLSVHKTFVSATEPAADGTFSATYQIRVENTGGSPDIYDLEDQPQFDTNITVNGAAVTGYVSNSFTGAGPYGLATNEPIAAGATTRTR